MSNDWLNNLPADQVIAWRRYIHQNPELSFKEYKTSQYIEEVLRSFGNLRIEKPTATSVLAILKGEGPRAATGKTVMLRADIDALPVPDETGTDYTSVNPGISHACGHDTHAAMLLGAAKVLSENRELINGTVLFIFQHAEELPPGGAIEIIQSPVMQDRKIDAVFGLHSMTNQKAGLILIYEDGPCSTAADGFAITITGKGAHGSMPDKGIDPILTGSELVLALNTIVSRNIKPGKFGVVSVGTFNAGVANNVIPEVTTITGTVRTTEEDIRQTVEERIRTITEHVCKVNGAQFEIKYDRTYGAVVNDKVLSHLALAAVKKVNGEENAEFDPEMTSGSEDFSAYAKLAPICFIKLGGGNKEEGYGFSNHNPKFNVVEDSLLYGVRAEVQIVLDFLNSDGEAEETAPAVKPAKRKSPVKSQVPDQVKDQTKDQAEKPAKKGRKKTAE